MSDDPQIGRYLKRVRTALHLPRNQRRRAVEEIRQHIEDGAAAHMQKGASREQGIALIISELGPADAVASEFNDEGTKGSPSTGLWRWLPLAPPLILFVVAAAVSGWSLVWLANGWTVGERATQRAYLLSALTFGVLAYAAHFSIRRAKHESAWRWAAWACMGLALVVGVVAPL